MAFFTLENPKNWQQKIRRSSFICFLFPISSAEEARELLAAHAKEYANATHNCFAYILGLERETQYWSDAGEPRGSAGKPILNALLRANMTNTLAIVTRYYGGVKLGIPGLIEAYGNTVEQALEDAKILPVTAQTEFVVQASYAAVDQLGGLVKSLEGRVVGENWGEEAELTLAVPTEKAPELRDYLDGQAAQSRLKYTEKGERE